MVSRDRRPEFIKTGDDRLRTNARHRAKFRHSQPNGIYEKSVTIFFTFAILAPHGDPLGLSSPIWVVITPPLYQAAKFEFRPLLETPV